MKKIAFLATFVMSFTLATAQSHYYHLVGDTVRGRCPIYYYDWWPDFDSTNRYMGYMDSAVNTDLYMNGYMRHLPDSALTIIGIATPLQFYNRYTLQEEAIDQYFDTIRLFLFKNTPNGMVELKRVNIGDDYLTHPKRYIELPNSPITHAVNHCDTTWSHNVIVPLREYYFDNSIYITDSFYLGYHEDYSTNATGENFQYIIDHSTRYGIMYSLKHYGFNTDPCLLHVPLQTYINNMYNQWSQNITFNVYSLVFPIIKVDTVGLPYDTAFFSCATPIKVQATQHTESLTCITWVGNGQSEWQVSIVPSGGNPDNGSIYHVTSPFINLYTLSPDTAYDIYVKGHCAYEWSGWSNPEHIDVLTAIGNITEQPFSLSPNPASSTVTLTTDLHQGLVEILDLQGRVLRTLPLAGGETLIDISGLAAGTYLVRLVTPEGPFSRKLTVE